MGEEEEEEGAQLAQAKCRCHHCGKPCLSFEELGDHLKVDHAQSEDLLCPYCNREDMLTYGRLTRHVKQTHGVVLLEQGAKIGRFRIRKPLSVSKDPRQGILWEVKCGCGRTSRAWEGDLKAGKKTACGECGDAKTPEAPKARAGKFHSIPEDGPADEQDLVILERASAAKLPGPKNERLKSITVTLADPHQRAAQPPAQNFYHGTPTRTDAPSQALEAQEAAQPPGENFYLATPNKRKGFPMPTPMTKNFPCRNCGEPRASARSRGQHERNCKGKKTMRGEAADLKNSPSLSGRDGVGVLPLPCNCGQKIELSPNRWACPCGKLWKLGWIAAGTLKVEENGA